MAWRHSGPLPATTATGQGRHIHGGCPCRPSAGGLVSLLLLLLLLRRLLQLRCLLGLVWCAPRQDVQAVHSAQHQEPMRLRLWCSYLLPAFLGLLQGLDRCLGPQKMATALSSRLGTARPCRVALPGSQVRC